MSATLSANMRSTTEAFVRAFDGEWLPEATMSLRAPECEHIVLPTSLGFPKRSNAEWAEFYDRIAGSVKDAKMTISDYVEMPSERRAVCWSSMTSSTSVGPFKNEYIWLFSFNETGQKVTKITEFVDSAAVKDLWARREAAGATVSH